MNDLAITDRVREQIGTAMASPATVDTFEPGFFSGTFDQGLGRGLYSSYASVRDLALDGTRTLRFGVAGILDELTGTDFRSDIAREPERLSESRERWRPDPTRAGAVAEVLFGVASILPQAVVGALAAGPPGAAALVGSTTTNSVFDDLLDKGVDPVTALGTATVQGGLAAGGVLAPAAIGRTLLTRIWSGAALNAAIGAGGRYLTNTILEARGYSDLASQYRALDFKALVADAILGGAFGGLSRIGHVADAAREAVVERHVEIEASPGIPTSLDSRRAHVEALLKAEADILTGRRVDVNDRLDGAEFIRREAGDAIVAARQAIREDMGIEAADALGRTERAAFEAAQGAQRELVAVRRAIRDIERLGQREALAIARLFNDPDTARVLAQINSEISRPNLSERARERLLAQREQVLAGPFEASAAEIETAISGNFLAEVERLPQLREAAKAAAKDYEAKRAEFERVNREFTEDYARRALAEPRGAEEAPARQGEAPAGPAGTAGEAVRPAPRDGAEPAGARAPEGATIEEKALGAAPAAPASDAEVAALAERILAEVPDLEIVDAETGEARSAKDLLAAADKEATEAREQRTWYDAAIQCFLRFGDEA